MLIVLVVAGAWRLPRLVGFPRRYCVPALSVAETSGAVAAMRAHRSDGGCHGPLVVAAGGKAVAVGAWALPMRAPSGHWTGAVLRFGVVAGYLGLSGCRLKNTPI